MKRSIKLLAASFLLSVATLNGHPGPEKHDREERTCSDIASEINDRIAADKEAVLSIVSEACQENSDCAGEIAGAAIDGSNASNELAGQIVEVAGTVAPSQINSIVQAAFARGGESSRATITAAANRVAGDSFSPSVAFPASSAPSPSGIAGVDYFDAPVGIFNQGGAPSGVVAVAPNIGNEVITVVNP